MSEIIDKKQWLEMRRTGIGGSDSAAALGLSKWKTPYQLYLEKIGEAETIETEAMKWGKIHEPQIRQEYANVTGRTVVQSGFMVHPRHHFIVGNVDGLVGDDRVLEIKTAKTAEGWGEQGTDEIPDEYVYQVQHYLLLTGRSVCDVVVLIGGNDYRTYQIDSDQEMHEMMIAGYKEFWQMVVNRTPPAITQLADLKQRYKRSIANAVHADSLIMDACYSLQKLKLLSDKIEQRSDELKAFIQGHMKENDTLVFEENIIATWKTGKRIRYVDGKKFEQDHPELIEPYVSYKEGNRIFLLKELPPQGIEDHVNSTSTNEQPVSLVN